MPRISTTVGQLIANHIVELSVARGTNLALDKLGKRHALARAVSIDGRNPFFSIVWVRTFS